MVSKVAIEELEALKREFNSLKVQCDRHDKIVTQIAEGHLLSAEHIAEAIKVAFEDWLKTNSDTFPTKQSVQDAIEARREKNNMTLLAGVGIGVIGLIGMVGVLGVLTAVI